jgi:histidinol-phosphate aminotransferase
MPLHRLPHINKRMAIAALKDDGYYDAITAKLIASREKLITDLNKLPGVTAFKSDSNFIYVRTKGYDPEKIKQICADNGYLVRIFTNGVEKHLRMTIATEDVMESFTKMLLKAFDEAKLSE